MDVSKMQRVGEVIRSSTSGFTAQCYELDCFPPLGGLVKTKNADCELFAVVFNAATAGIDPGRKPLARGKDEGSEEALYKASPQIVRLLKSEFEALSVGYKEDNKIFQYLPPRPVPIHSFVYTCSDADVVQFSSQFEFLNTLLNSAVSLPHEELIAAVLRNISRVHEDKHSFLVAAGKHLATTLSGDYNRLRTILERIKQ